MIFGTISLYIKVTKPIGLAASYHAKTKYHEKITNNILFESKFNFNGHQCPETETRPIWVKKGENKAKP